MNCGIRPAVSDDLPVLVELLRLKAEFDGCPEAFQADAEALGGAWFAAPPRAYALVAECEGRLVGLATYYDTFSTFTGKPGVWLDDLFLLDEYRGRGIGRKLMSTLAREAIARGCARMEWTAALSNTRGLAFYEDLGASVGHSTRYVRLTGESIQELSRETPLSTPREASVPASDSYSN